jgi:heme-degrading monooxygenase HmoA
MIVVVSQAWTKDADASAEAYVAGSRDLARMMEGHPGFRGRKLLRSQEDPTHFTHLRWFDAPSDYESLTKHPNYGAHIARLSQHLDLSKYEKSAREIMEVVLDE